MDAWWIAPVVALGASGVLLVVAGAAARRASAALAADHPVVEAVRAEVGALRADLQRVADRVDRHRGGAGTGTPAR